MRLGSKNQLYILLLFAIILSSCSNQESWAYKEWHNTLAHYNTFFNAEQKWIETVGTTREGYKDDFRKPISLINYGTIDILKENQAAMDEVIKKASTMIDKHPRPSRLGFAVHYQLLGSGSSACSVTLSDLPRPTDSWCI